jgi:membrane protein required for colicin V production
MEIALVDLILVILVGAFVFYGAFFGFIHTLGSLIGAIIGVAIASRIIDPISDWVGFIFGGGAWARIILFIIIVLVIIKLLGIVVDLIERVWSIVPFGRSLDRLLGLVFGFIEGVLVIGIIIYFAMTYLPQGTVRSALETSSVSDYLLTVADTASILLPEALEQADQAIDNIEIPDIDLKIEINAEKDEAEEALPIQ